jgi:Ras-related protein Rab-8A
MIINKIAKRLGMKTTFKIVIAGDGAVGKTTISQRLTNSMKELKNTEMTCGIDFHTLEIGRYKKAQIWDLGGQVQFRKFQKPFFKKADMIILVYSVERFSSFLNLENWLELMHDVSPIKLFLLANKIDLVKRVISKDEASEFAATHNMAYFEISGLSGEGFEEFKNELIRTVADV